MCAAESLNRALFEIADNVIVFCAGITTHTRRHHTETYLASLPSPDSFEKEVYTTLASG